MWKIVSDEKIFLDFLILLFYIATYTGKCCNIERLNMKSIHKIFNENRGYAYLRDLKKRGIHTDTIKKQLDEGIIEKVKPGLYKLADKEISAEQGMIDVCIAMPKAVVCLHSALSYYELTTTVPSVIMVALPRGIKPVKLYYPPIKVFHFSNKNHISGIKLVETPFGNFRIYDVEKTIVDCFRFRNKLGEDVAIEGLRNYFSTYNYHVNKIVKYAKEGRIFSIMEPYLKAYLQR